MYSELEKIDILRHRVVISYEEAQAILQQFEGDLINTLVYLEKHKPPVVSAKEQVLKEIKELLEAGKIRRIRVIRGNKVYVDIPVAVGVVGLMGAALSTPLMVMTALATAIGWTKDFHLLITGVDGKVQNHQYHPKETATCKRSEYFTQGLLEDLLAKEGLQ